MRIDYRKLGQIAVDPRYWNISAKDTSDVLANYLYLMSNLNADVDAWSVSEMAMVTNSLNRWQDRKTQLNRQRVSVGDILIVDLGLHYAPELSYGHPALVLEEWKTSCLSFLSPVHHQNLRRYTTRQTTRPENGITERSVFQTVSPMTVS